VDLQQYRAKLIEDGKAPTTINNRLRAVKAVFHWARDDEAYWSQLRDRHHAVNIEFTGEKPHDEAMKMLAAADVFVLPSHTEGFPNVVLEAMALSKPVIATRVGAIPEMLGGDCGLLVEPQDVASLKMALARLMEDRELQRRLGREGYRRAVTQYSIDTVFLQYIDLWKQAIAAG
jgi:glycosyltransferase involved in cell wall biosynthesis